MNRILTFIGFLVVLVLVGNLSSFKSIEPSPANDPKNKGKVIRFSLEAEEKRYKNHIVEMEKLAVIREERANPKVMEEVEEAPVVLVELTTPRLEKGHALYAKCIACHGKGGEGKKAQKAPRIGGQSDWYIETQLANMKSGKRPNKIMNPYLKPLKGDDIKDLAHYISKLPWDYKK